MYFPWPIILMQLHALCCTFLVWGFLAGFSCFFGVLLLSHESSCFLGVTRCPYEMSWCVSLERFHEICKWDLLMRYAYEIWCFSLHDCLMKFAVESSCFSQHNLLMRCHAFEPLRDCLMRVHAFCPPMRYRHEICRVLHLHFHLRFPSEIVCCSGRCKICFSDVMVCRWHNSLVRVYAVWLLRYILTRHHGLWAWRYFMRLPDEFSCFSRPYEISLWDLLLFAA